VPGGKRWSEEEVHLLRSKYPTHGPERVAEMMPGRTAAGVKTKAMHLGLSVGDVSGWVPISLVATQTGLHINTVRERAQRSGVTRAIRGPGRNLKLIVPEAWADAYVSSVRRGREAEELAQHHYDLKKTARIFGVHPQTLRKWLYGTSPSSNGARIMSRVRFIVTTGVQRRSYLFNPYDVEREAKLYRAQKEES